jgi:hypothetical protein
VGHESGSARAGQQVLVPTGTDRAHVRPDHRHLADAYGYYCGRPTNPRTQWSDAIAKGPTDKATLAPKLEQALDACNAAYSGNGDIGQLMANVAHTSLHYGNLVTYIRMLGMVPPSS